MKKIKSVDYCNFCNKLAVNKDIYTIYQVIISTDKDEYIVGLLTIIPDLDKYLVSKVFHLSPTEVILLRPDILLEFLRGLDSFKDEEVINWGLEFSKICIICYEKYKKEVPER